MAANVAARLATLRDRFIPAGADEDLRRRCSVQVAFVAIVVVMALMAIPFEAAGQHWRAVGCLVAGAVLLIATLAWIRRGRVLLAGHVATGTFVVALLAIASDKGGLAATELNWQSAAIVFAVFVVGVRGGLFWVMVASAGVFAHALAFDPTRWKLDPALELGQPLLVACDLTLMFATTWALASVFDEARAAFLARLSARNEQMRAVLDHVRDGLLSIDRQGVIAEERSAVVDAWLGPIAPGTCLWDLLGRDTAGQSDWLSVCWDGVIDDVLPRELALEQLPRHITLAGRSIELRVSPIEQAGRVVGALVALYDVSDAMARERLESSRRDLSNVIEAAHTDGPGALGFLDEMDRLASRITQSLDLTVVLRDIHTMKGNAALFGAVSVAAACHEVEASLLLSGGSSSNECARLADHWTAFSAACRRWVLGVDAGDSVRVDRTQLAALRLAITTRAPHHDLEPLLRSWGRDPISRVLTPLARQGKALASELKKQVEVRVLASEARIDRERFAPVLASLVHVLRNAIDHGIEPPEERVLAGKSAAGEVRLSAVEVAGRLDIEIEDNGRGIDWEAVRRRAIVHGLPSSTHADLVQAIFSDGVSTRDGVSSTSGRGVGLAALRASVTELGGQIAVESWPGRGCRFRISLPLDGQPCSLHAPGGDETENTKRPPGTSARRTIDRSSGRRWM